MYRSAFDKLLLAMYMVSVTYWAMQDGSCNKTYLYSLPGHVGGHTRRHRLIKQGGEQVSPLAATEPLLALFTPSTFPCFHLDH